MSFLDDVATYVENNVAELTLDDNLLIGGFLSDSPDRAVSLNELSPGVESESGLLEHPIQFLSRDVEHYLVRELAYSVYELFNNKPGFAADITAFYSEVLGAPSLILHTDKFYIFSFNILFKRESGAW